MRGLKRVARSRTRRSFVPQPKDAEIHRALDEACRQDLLSFVQVTFDMLNPRSLLSLNWHIEAMAFHLEQVRLGKIKRLIINLPPRSLKSIVTSVAFPAYVLGHDPTKKIIVASYGSELAVKHANDFRAVMSSARYRQIFPETRLSRLKNTELEVVTTLGGSRLATSVDGPLTGRGGDIIIIDDPLKPADALSDNKREHVNRWFANTLISRLDDKLNGAIIIVMQRLHVDDLCGAVLKRVDHEWTVLNLPAIAEQDETILIGEKRFHLRQAGDVLHPEREPMAVLERIRGQVGSDVFAAQYQQRPVPPGGVMIKRDSIRRYDQPPTRTASSLVVQSWDTATKAGGENDYSVCTTWLIQEKNYYLLDLLRGRFDYPLLKTKAISHAQEHKPKKILIEDSGVGSALVAELKNAAFTAVAIKPEGNKLTRMSIQSTKFEGGHVFLPNQAPWLAELEAELFAFPNVPHDDQVDSISQALSQTEPPSCIWDDKTLEGWGRFVSGFYFPY